jgi:hypothetical protein
MQLAGEARRVALRLLDAVYEPAQADHSTAGPLGLAWGAPARPRARLLRPRALAAGAGGHGGRSCLRDREGLDTRSLSAPGSLHPSHTQSKNRLRAREGAVPHTIQESPRQRGSLARERGGAGTWEGRCLGEVACGGACGTRRVRLVRKEGRDVSS